MIKKTFEWGKKATSIIHFYTFGKLKRLYERTELFFCNREEAERILHAPLVKGESDVKTLLHGIGVLGPKIVCITDGPVGAYCYDGHVSECWFQPPYPDPKPPLNRTGAGDAFASTFTAAIILGKSVREALALAPINSAFVVQQIGAQRGLLSRAQLETYLAAAPERYRVQKL
mgnify:CR=1 FL=1